MRGELDQVQEKLRVLEAKLLDHSNHSEVYFDRIYDLEHWREVQEARRVNRASSPIDLTGDPDSDSEDEVVEIPGFPTEFPRTLVPLEDVPAPGEVCILFLDAFAYY